MCRRSEEIEWSTKKHHKNLQLANTLMGFDKIEEARTLFWGRSN
jgi:hypothetical protein